MKLIELVDCSETVCVEKQNNLAKAILEYDKDLEVCSALHQRPIFTIHKLGRLQ